MKPKSLLHPNASQLIAITGGIGTGKTFVLNYFKKLGFTVFNADDEIHKMFTQDSSVYEEIINLFPESLNVEGKIDRKSIGKMVFNDIYRLKLLESILHPKLRDVQSQFIIDTQKNSNKSMVFEIPLLFENNLYKDYDYIILTTAKLSVRKKRVMLRNNMTEDKFNAIIKSQVTDEIRLNKSHFVIRTDTSEEQTYKQIKAIIKNDTS